MRRQKENRITQSLPLPEKVGDTFELDLALRNNITTENVMDILEKEIGIVFTHVLEDAGVFKCTEEGRKAFRKFIRII